MTSVAVLIGLLVTATVGSLLLGGYRRGPFGFASGTEYLLLGFILGPVALGVVERSIVAEFAPLTLSAVSWLGLGAGQRFGLVDDRATRVHELLLGIMFSALVFSTVAFSVWWATRTLLPVPPEHRLLLTLGVAAVLSDTSWRAIFAILATRALAPRFAGIQGSEKPGTTMQASSTGGAVSRWMTLFARTSVVCPVLTLAALSAASNVGWGPTRLATAVGLTLGLGVGTGLIAVVLLSREPRLNQSWGILLGTGLLALGLAVRLGLSPFAALFALGLTLTTCSSQRRELYALTHPVDLAVSVPTLLLAGLYLEIHQPSYALPLVVVALAARMLAETGRGAILWLAIPTFRKLQPKLGLALHTTGPVAVAIALSYALMTPGAVASLLLAIAVVGAGVSEVVSVRRLRRILTHSGEVPPSESTPDTQSAAALSEARP